MTDEPTSFAAGPRDRAVSCLHAEHRALSRIIEALETVVAQTIETGIDPDFTLIASMIYYVDAVPEKLHHPKEDRYLFAALRSRSEEAAPMLERLARDHQRCPQLVSELERSLVHWQGGAPDGTDGFALALARFCEFHANHMRIEETVILPLAERSLAEDDWRAMAEAFGAHSDPLFGEHRRAEFDRLYHRIANLSPRRLKLSLLRSARHPVAD